MPCIRTSALCGLLVLALLLVSLPQAVAVQAQAVAPWTLRISTAANGAQARGDSSYPTVSADGRYVLFGSEADNLVDGDTDTGGFDQFLLDRQLGQLRRIPKIANAKLSANGAYLVFETAERLVEGDQNDFMDVYRLNWNAKTLTLVSRGVGGTQANGDSFAPAISADGCRIAFTSEATNLTSSGVKVAAVYWQVYAWDCGSAEIELVSATSTGQRGNRDSWRPGIAANGRFVVFSSEADNLVSLGTLYSDQENVYVRDLETNVTEHVSKNTNGSLANNSSRAGAISADGRYVAFTSAASDLVGNDTNVVSDVFVRDRVANVTTRVSLGDEDQQADTESGVLDISDDGRYVLFVSRTDNLVADDDNGKRDLFVRDRQAGQTRRVSVGSDGRSANQDTTRGALAGNRPIVVFAADADNLVFDDTNQHTDVFLHDWTRQPQPWPAGALKLEAETDGIAVNGQNVPAGEKVPLRDGTMLRASCPAAASSLHMDCGISAETVLLLDTMFPCLSTEDVAIETDILFILSVGLAEAYATKHCKQPPPQTSAAAIETEPLMQLLVEQGSLRTDLLQPDLAIDLATDLGSLHLAGGADAEVVHDPARATSEFQVYAGSALLTPQAASIAPQQLTPGVRAELTATTLNLEPVGTVLYLPEVCR